MDADNATNTLRILGGLRCSITGHGLAGVIGRKSLEGRRDSEAATVSLRTLDRTGLLWLQDVEL